MLPTRLRGALTHNLKGVDLDVMPGEVLVLTGVSGSGKSSLALDTLYAEGQRRFVESFSPYARQFLERLPRPPMESLAPVGAGVVVDRGAPIKSSRSTLATMADLEAYLAGLFAKESTPFCPDHGEAARHLDAKTGSARVLAAFSGQRLLICSPAHVGEKEEYLALREALLRDGLRRVICAKKLYDLDDLKPSVAEKSGRIDVVVDRVVAEEKSQRRIEEALEISFAKSAGVLTDGQSWIYSDADLTAPLHLRHGLSCPECTRPLLPPRPGYFSYESPLAACENCRGFGRVMGVDLDKVIPNESLSLADGAVRPWRGPKTAWERKQLNKFCLENDIPWELPWAELSKKQQRMVFEGTGKRGRANYWGISEWFEWLNSKAYKMHVRVFLARYRSYDPCPVCEGSRLNESSLWYRLAGLDLSQWHRLEVSEALALLSELEPQTPHGRTLKSELLSRLRYLSRVGLGYLTLDRQARTLSGGETQRVTLTAALGTTLHNALFVLDEPTVGLHATDIQSLAELTRELAERNNAVIVIEHEPLMIEAADRVVELGPRAGTEGGKIVFDGTVSGARRNKGATARALSRPEISREEAGLPIGSLSIFGASVHNLKNVDAEFPLGRLISVCGPSGSGKSSLLVDVLYRSVARHLGSVDVERPGEHKSVKGLSSVKMVELVDQSPLGRTSRGNAATYTKAWDVVRKLFASEPQSVARGYTSSHFSFNVAGGRCEACSGEGSETVEMQFLADVSLVCPVCSGRRFKDEVLAVRYRDHSISDVLSLTIDEALRLFEDKAPIRRALAPLAALGLGYLRLGQALSTLSGGEAQRLKLARALASPKPGTLYILDEPSAGLHADEVELLVDALRVLVRSGGTVAFVDHDLSLIAASNWVLELGPGGGKDGGSLVFSGTPEELEQSGTSTGLALLEARSQSVKKSVPRRKPVRNRKVLSVQGAREHTLKDVSCEVPHQKLTVVTGPSGSGKSTLAFDVIFAEGQRRFLETLTPYARRFLPTLPRPNVDVVEGVPPAIALEQRSTRVGSRSTVATVTEVAHYLRLAYAKLATPHCPDHDQAIGHFSVEELWARLQKMSGRGSLLAPAVRGRKGTYLDVFAAAARAGFPWAVADSKRVSCDDPPRLAKTKEHDISIVVRDSVSLKEIELEAFREAIRWGRGTVHIQTGGQVTVLSTGGTCHECGFSIGDIDPRYFSFNTVQGQCAGCEGTGVVAPKKVRGRRVTVDEKKTCPDCGGARLSPFARRAILKGHSYPSLTALSVGELQKELRSWTFKDRDLAISSPIMKELDRRVAFLSEVGLDYLSLDRAASTLSGGEIQRLRLAAQLGADLTGALYVLDEPTIGLHPRDTARLLDNLRRLVDTGSTVLMVEHDQDAIAAADHLIDLGPRGGTHGGTVVAAGTPESVLKNPASPTGQAFKAKPVSRRPQEFRKDHPQLRLTGASQNNLKGEELLIPHSALTVVAGVSGSGKSSLIRDVLLPALKKKLSLVGPPPGAFQKLTGFEEIKRAVAVDQSPIGRTPRSVPATFLGIFDLIRKLFEKTSDARMRGFTASRFSFNTPNGGRCPTCEGQGVLSHEMSFLPDAVTPCPACDSLRFDARTLEVRFVGKSIGEILALSCEEAIEIFSAHPKICAPLKVLCDLGAGYITLGQGSHTLSGGEAQRLKLAAELCAGTRHEHTLYVLDEPTTGLHLSDVGRLVEVLGRLVSRGDTCVVIEHQPDLIAAADWVVELGPEGGPQGGHIVFQGSVEALRRTKTATALVLQ
jgi:excinuclease ABC subunit A